MLYRAGNMSVLPCGGKYCFASGVLGLVIRLVCKSEATAGSTTKSHKQTHEKTAKVTTTLHSMECHLQVPGEGLNPDKSEPAYACGLLALSTSACNPNHPNSHKQYRTRQNKLKLVVSVP